MFLLFLNTLETNMGNARLFKTFKWRAWVRATFEQTNQRAHRLLVVVADWLSAHRSEHGRGASLIAHLNVEIS